MHGTSFHMLDVVQLTRAHPDHALSAGATGTVVEILEHPRLAYEVEFLDEGGEFLAELAVTPDNLALVKRHA